MPFRRLYCVHTGFKRDYSGCQKGRSVSVPCSASCRRYHSRRSIHSAIDGVSNQHAIDAIASDDYEVILAVDNDTAGASCRNKNGQFSAIVPEKKDWNEDLQMLFAGG